MIPLPGIMFALHQAIARSWLGRLVSRLKNMIDHSALESRVCRMPSMAFRGQRRLSGRHLDARHRSEPATGSMPTTTSRKRRTSPRLHCLRPRHARQRAGADQYTVARCFRIRKSGVRHQGLPDGVRLAITGRPLSRSRELRHRQPVPSSASAASRRGATGAPKSTSRWFPRTPCASSAASR